MNRRRFLAASPLLLLLPKGSTMPTTIPYQASLNVTLDASGNGTLTFNGPPSLTTRTLSNVVVYVDQGTPRPRAAVYRSVIAPNRLMGATPLGNDDTLVADPGDVLQSGEPLIVVFTGGAPGARATANVNGSDLRA